MEQAIGLHPTKWFLDAFTFALTPAEARKNTPAALKAAFQSFVDAGHFLDYSFGSDMTEVEQRLIPALRRLQGANKWELVRMAWSGRPAEEGEALGRLGLGRPGSVGEWVYARVVAGALASVASR